MYLIRCVCLSLIFLAIPQPQAYADLPPVVDMYSDQPQAQDENTQESDATEPVSEPSQQEVVPVPEESPARSSTPSRAQRLNVIERQLANMTPLINQISELRQQIQNLQNQLDIQQHNLQLLQAKSSVSGAIAASQAPSTSVSVQNSDKNYLNKLANVQEQTINRLGSTASAARTVAGDDLESAEVAYQAAFTFLKNNNYSSATHSFEHFVKQYPENMNTANARYFLGQLYLLQGNPEESIARFQVFLQQYPQDTKVPDALLQLGLAYFAKGNKNRAIATFQHIISKYPKTDAAVSAKTRLQQLQAPVTSRAMNHKRVV